MSQAANARKLLNSGALNEARAEFRRPSPLQISNFWRNWARYPDTRVWNHDGILRHNHVVPNTAPGIFTPRSSRFVIPLIFVGLGAAWVSNELVFRGKKKAVFGPQDDDE
mmetsp:Transcript_14635/g.22846  ORF Transcript_14635/g.22846 Transcript_14635/m.22846 type:complete len:110 (-) Transcript_14635:114-443(-)|eukprot:CAMPEP_0201523088 /NCGR_PEP_ID=MMETSP0161_2-20130828/18735_1 /ASSEMBLY_ACC=CAM_ASM_000251 /TAXON_ID=180227 /ORGANISM="Neoparamoeba aestuarina, Strain SoJaBio B1-5/56/2" /LENGTH=109 /DNA_ID=CAMNT_0047922087 /DNA_START=72 /DNA_END=401 /DNA_ORIENTATION=-